MDSSLINNIPPVKMCFTVKDLVQEMQRINISTDLTKVSRAMKPLLVIENIGKTDLKNVIVTLFIEENNNWSQMPPIDKQVTLSPNGILQIPITIFFPLDGPMPDIIN